MELMQWAIGTGTHPVFSRSLSWKGHANIPSYLIPPNLAQGLGKDRLNQGSVDSTCLGKNHVGELESRRHNLKQYYNFGRHHGPSSAMRKKHLLSCKSSEVIALGTPHLYNNRREFLWGNIARYFFLVDFFFFFFSKGHLKKHVIWTKDL